MWSEGALLKAEHNPVAPGTCTEAVGPFVTSSNITDGARGVSTSTQITAIFSEAMDPTTIKVANSEYPEVLTFTLMTEAEVMNNDVRKERNKLLQRWLQHSQPQGKPQGGEKEKPDRK